MGDTNSESRRNALTCYEAQLIIMHSKNLLDKVTVRTIKGLFVFWVSLHLIFHHAPHYLHFIQVLPPPVMPSLKLQYAGIWNLLQSDLMLYLLKQVVDRADNLKSKCFSENQVGQSYPII